MVVLGVSFDSPAENGAFAEKFSFPFMLLCDERRDLGLAYGACEARDAGYPKRVSYLIDERGAIARVYGKVDPKGHPDEVLASL